MSLVGGNFYLKVELCTIFCYRVLRNIMICQTEKNKEYIVKRVYLKHGLYLRI